MKRVQWDWKWISVGGAIAVIVFILVVLMSSCPANAQPTSSTISPRAFGAKSWRENGLAPGSLPLTGNTLWDVRLTSDAIIYYWNGSAWVAISGLGGSSSDDQTAVEVSITDLGAYYSGSEVEAALQQIGADPRWSDARIPLTHSHSAGETTSGIFSDSRISSSSVIQYESAIEGVLDLSDLQGVVTDAQVPDTITKSGTASRCARFDASGVLVAASGDCVSGDTDTTGSASPGGSNTQIQFNDGGSFGGDSDLTYNKTNNDLTLASDSQIIFGSSMSIERQGIPSGSIFEITDGGTGVSGLHSGDIVSSGAIYLDMKGSNAYVGDGWNWAVGTSGVFGGSTWRINFSSTSDGDGVIDTRVVRSAAGIVGFESGSGGGAGRLAPVVSPPCTCGTASCEGVYYTDSSHALCYCGATVWINLTPSDGGSCS